MYYIRFLKPPVVLKNKSETDLIEAIVTITTDLGDTFYPNDQTLSIWLESGRTGFLRFAHWKNGMRSIKIEARISSFRKELEWPVQMKVVGDGKRSSESMKTAEDLPEIVSAWSGNIDVFEGRKVPNRVERRISRIDGTGGYGIRVWEETGESIARHVWDAGLVMSAYFLKSPEEIANDRFSPYLQKMYSQSSRPSIIELGSGCGLVGIGFAQMLSDCDVLLTDLPEAMEILNYNISIAKPAKGSTLRAKVLEWGEAPSSGWLEHEHFDFILISDCTYNCDSVPALIQTLCELVPNSPELTVIVSMKIRHISEAIFFDLMAETDFVAADRIEIPLPDSQRSQSGQELETVEMFVFTNATAFNSLRQEKPCR